MLDVLVLTQGRRSGGGEEGQILYIAYIKC